MPAAGAGQFVMMLQLLVVASSRAALLMVCLLLRSGSSHPHDDDDEQLLPAAQLWESTLGSKHRLSRLPDLNHTTGPAPAQASGQAMLLIDVMQKRQA
eukprot:COSAG05_NODE_9680_length_608_cov_0.809430_1_plen_97_part_10